MFMLHNYNINNKASYEELLTSRIHAHGIQLH